MVPIDFFLFQKLKLPHRGTHFQSTEDIKEISNIFDHTVFHGSLRFT